MSRAKLSGAARRRRMKSNRLHHEHIIYEQEDPVVERPGLEHLILAQASGPTSAPMELINPTVSSPVMDDVDAVVFAVHPAPELHQQERHQQPQQQEQLQPRPHDGPRGHGHWKGSQHARNLSLQHQASCHYQPQVKHRHERRVSYPPSASQQQQQQQEQNYYIPAGEVINPQVRYQQFTQVTTHDDFTYHHEQAWHGKSMPPYPYEPQHHQQQVQLQQQFGGYSSPNGSDEGSLKGDYGFQGGAGDYINASGEQTNYYPGSSYPYHHEQHEQAPVPFYEGPPPPPPFATGYTMLTTGSSYHRHTPSSSYDLQASYPLPFYGNPQPHGVHAEAVSSPYYYQQQQLQEGVSEKIEQGVDCSNYNPPCPDMRTMAVIQQGSSNSSSNSSSGNYGSGTDEDMKALEQRKRAIMEKKRKEGMEEEVREEVLTNGVRKITRGELTHYIYPEDAARLTQAEVMTEISASGHSHNSNLPLERQQHHQQIQQHHYHHHQQQPYQYKSGGSSSSSDSEKNKGGKTIRSYRTKRRGQLRSATNNTRNKTPSEQQQQQNQPKWNGFPRMPLFSTTDYAGKTYTFYQPDDYQHVICYPTRFFHCPQPPLALPAREMERRGLPYGPTYGPLAPWHFPCERPQPMGAGRK
eukprot:evm.model.NODE_19561_length_17155_cov_60.828564.3